MLAELVSWKVTNELVLVEITETGRLLALENDVLSELSIVMAVASALLLIPSIVAPATAVVTNAVVARRVELLPLD